MSEHPIEGLMITAMNRIQDMVDVNTIIGEPIETTNGIVIIPISKVSFGFAAGGSEFRGETIDEYTKKDKEEAIQYRLPFGGGSGAGVNINPVAFLVIQENTVKLLPVNHTSSLDKLLDYIPDLVEKANTIIDKTMQNKKEEKKKEEVKNNTKNNKEEAPTRSKRRKVQTSRDDDYEIEYDETPPTVGKIIEEYDEEDD